MTPTVLGFTGTQRGMTASQLEAVRAWLQARTRLIVAGHHGDCIGADDQFDGLLIRLRIARVIHPPLINAKRAFCCRKGHPFTEFPPLSYLERNRKIVERVGALIATPGEAIEQLRSGTWATVRYARKLGRPIRLFLPDGSTLLEA